MNATSKICRPDSGEVVPIIDLAKCEGKADCIRVCPYDVFEIRVATSAERESLGMLAQFKSLVHGHKKAFAINTDQCHACGHCVKACPESAISLVKVQSSPVDGL